MVDKNSRVRVRLDSGQTGSELIMHLWETVLLILIMIAKIYKHLLNARK